ncbi:3-oxoacyl-[acyl-carrier protein] reductase [Devosia sp. YR412]|uniref:SDR family oxidoreductase n=1 Tax=Devosia sp. YR412 TaxID=1881030 RepID=UPI0008B2EDA9|nr:SDR family oxidoreductase [Devosia sp. YR412]SEQ29605.1 3-oxoacyl-[acyl-carrier protein] reductase [Devosia sp. YR412]
MKLGIAGKRAIVLGASKGLGAAIAVALANEGVTVIGGARSVDKITALNQRLEANTSGTITGLSLDLSDPASVAAFISAVESAGGADIVVNNSGGPPPGEAGTIAPAEFSRAFDTMVTPLVAITQAMLPGMKARRWGRIVTLTSSGVEAPIARLALSNALRQSLVGWSKTLAAEVAGDNITANVVVQGRVHTDRVDELDAGAAKRLGKSLDEVRAQSIATIPAGRYGRPEELADVVTFLASERSSYITGSLIRVDGGMLKNI